MYALNCCVVVTRRPTTSQRPVHIPLRIRVCSYTHIERDRQHIQTHSFANLPDDMLQKRI